MTLLRCGLSEVCATPGEIKVGRCAGERLRKRKVCEYQRKRNSRSLHYAPPDFLLRLVALANFMRSRLAGTAHVAVDECREAGNLGTLRSEVVTFLISFRFWWPESSEERRPTNILGVLRLRAQKPLLSDRSARRFAQDDGFVGVLETLPVGCAKNSKIKKVTTSRDDNSIAGSSISR